MFVYHSFKNVIKDTFLYDIIKHVREKQALRDWEKKGKPAPPPHIVKKRTVKEFAKRFSVHTLVETGTYLGDMVYATKNTFSRIFSIEIDEILFMKAKKRFDKFNHISIIQGDSAKVLPDLLKNINHPCLFWLDGHYSGGITGKGELKTPIMQELQCILKHPVEEHIILIDDAWYFVGQNDYPLLEGLKNFVSNIDSSLIFEVENDIIRIYKLKR